MDARKILETVLYACGLRKYCHTTWAIAPDGSLRAGERRLYVGGFFFFLPLIKHKLMSSLVGVLCLSKCSHLQYCRSLLVDSMVCWCIFGCAQFLDLPPHTLPFFKLCLVEVKKKNHWHLFMPRWWSLMCKLMVMWQCSTNAGLFYCLRPIENGIPSLYAVRASPSVRINIISKSK